MITHTQDLHADCIVEFQRMNPDTQEMTWEEYETMTIQAPNVEQMIDRAHMYLGRPERYENVQAIRLSATMTPINHQKDQSDRHEDTLTFTVHVLRERTTPVSQPTAHG